jgi:hypothetical protein
MNTLDYRETDRWGLSFELLVDGQPISALIGAWDTVSPLIDIPFWLIEDDLPSLPVDSEEYKPTLRILTVTSCCGEYGCGHTRCQVLCQRDTVLFCDFAGAVRVQARKTVFQFSRRNYDTIIEAMVWRARDHASNAK